MTIARVLMMCGMMLLPIGLIYGMSTHGDPQGMVVELTCLGLGGALFLGGRMYEKKQSG